MTEQKSDDELLTMSATARVLCRCVPTVRKYADQGRLAAVRLSSGARVFRRGDVEAFARALGANHRPKT